MKYFFYTVGGDTDSSFFIKWLKSLIFLFRPARGWVGGAKEASNERVVWFLDLLSCKVLLLVGFFFYLAMPPIYMNWIKNYERKNKNFSRLLGDVF